MKHIPFYILPLFLLISCGEAEQEEAGQIMEYIEEEPIDEEVVLEDEIEEDFEGIESNHVLFCRIGIYQEPALMVLHWGEQDENRSYPISGYYYYVRHQKRLDLNGYSEPSTRGIYLTESYKGKESGYMEFAQDAHIQPWDGENYWAPSKGSDDKQDFYSEDLFFQEPEEANLAIQMDQYRYPHGIQVYNGETWDDEEVTDELNWMIVNDKYFMFDIHVTRANAHMGSISGVCPMTEGATEITYIDDEQEGCKLVFDLSQKDQIGVTEYQCDYYHGMRAQFDGVYEKE